MSVTMSRIMNEMPVGNTDNGATNGGAGVFRNGSAASSVIGRRIERRFSTSWGEGG